MYRAKTEKPVKELKYIQDLFQENVLEKLRIITDESGIDIEENQKLVKDYHDCVNDASDLRDNISSLKTEKTAFIIMILLSIIVGIICVIKAISITDAFRWDGWKAVLFCIALIIAAMACFYISFRILLYIVNHLNALLADKEALQQQLDRKTEKAEEACYKSLEPFMARINEFFFQNLLQDTMDGFIINRYLNSQSIYNITNRSPGIFTHNKNNSTIDLISGYLFGNPFVIRKIRTHGMSYVAYEGHKEITIETETTDHQGNTVKTTKKETVKATISKPKPEYSIDYELLYVSDNAPDLSFSHNIEKPTSLNRRKARIDKKHREAVMKYSSGFTPMSNSEFDTLFYAIDRDNDLQFRELFTPVAQTNHVDLITELGDYYSLSKKKRLTIIKMKDDAFCWDLWNNPIKYKDYDYQVIMNKILETSNTSFNNFLCFFLPILSAPNYYRKSDDLYYCPLHEQLNYSELQAEVLVNYMDESIFAGRKTPIMVSAQGNGSENDVDYYTLSIQYYDEYTKVDTCDSDKPASDGKRYPVDIEWTEYVPHIEYYHMMVKDIGVANTAAYSYNEPLHTVLKQGLFGYVYSNDDMPDRTVFDMMIDDVLHQ